MFSFLCFSHQTSFSVIKTFSFLPFFCKCFWLIKRVSFSVFLSTHFSVFLSTHYSVFLSTYSLQCLSFFSTRFLCCLWVCCLAWIHLFLGFYYYICCSCCCCYICCWFLLLHLLLLLLLLLLPFNSTWPYTH